MPARDEIFLQVATTLHVSFTGVARFELFKEENFPHALPNLVYCRDQLGEGRERFLSTLEPREHNSHRRAVEVFACQKKNRTGRHRHTSNIVVLVLFFLLLLLCLVVFALPLAACPLVDFSAVLHAFVGVASCKAFILSSGWLVG